MTGGSKRIDQASRVVAAPPHAVYRALLDPDAVAQWRRPDGMRVRIAHFDAREGGGYRMALIYEAADHALPGKSGAHEDVVEGRFVELVPDVRVVEQGMFESDDPAFAGIMTITTTLAPVADGTRVTIACSDVPAGITPEDHAEGLAMSLAKLAAFVESEAL